MCKLGDYSLKRILYWSGSGLEFLSACLVAEGCQASKVFITQKEPLSMKLELSKSNSKLLFYSNFTHSGCTSILNYIVTVSCKEPTDTLPLL